MKDKIRRGSGGKKTQNGMSDGCRKKTKGED